MVVLDGQLATLTPEELTVVETLAQQVRESAQLIVRNRLEDVAVRVSRASRWCDEFRTHALRVIGAARGPRGAGGEGRYDATGKDLRHARIEYRDSDGLDCAGYNVDGWINGFGPDGFNAAGLDVDGFNRDGVDATGLSKYRFDRNGRDRDNCDYRGLDPEGYDREGFSRDGFNRDGRNRAGRDYNGYDAEGFNESGINNAGTRRDGTDRFGLNPFRFNRLNMDPDGFNRDGWNPTTRVQRPDAPPL